MCLGQQVKPPTQKSATFVFLLKLQVVAQLVISILNLITIFINPSQDFLLQGISGLLLAYILYYAYRNLSYLALGIYAFYSLFFTFAFISILLAFAQQGANINNLSNDDKYVFADAFLSFFYYIFSCIFVLFPCKEFKLIKQTMDPIFLKFYNLQNNQNYPAQPAQPDNVDQSHSQNIQQSQTKIKQQPTFQAFKGKGVRIN